METLINLWPVAVAISVVTTGLYVVCVKGFIRIDVGVSTNVGIELGKKTK